MLWLWGSSSYEFWSICSVISRNDRALFHSMRGKKIIKTFISHTPTHSRMNLRIFFLISCLWNFLAHLYWSRFLLSVMPLIVLAVIDRLWPPWTNALSFWHPQGIRGWFCGDALAPWQAKGHTWKDSEYVRRRGISPHVVYTKASLSLLCLKLLPPPHQKNVTVSFYYTNKTTDYKM